MAAQVANQAAMRKSLIHAASATLWPPAKVKHMLLLLLLRLHGGWCAQIQQCLAALNNAIAAIGLPEHPIWRANLPPNWSQVTHDNLRRGSRAEHPGGIAQDSPLAIARNSRQPVLLRNRPARAEGTAEADPGNGCWPADMEPRKSARVHALRRCAAAGGHRAPACGRGDRRCASTSPRARTAAPEQVTAGTVRRMRLHAGR